MLTLDSMIKSDKLDQTYKDSPKYPVKIGYLEINRETGEIYTYDLNGVKDKPIKE